MMRSVEDIAWLGDLREISRVCKMLVELLKSNWRAVKKEGMNIPSSQITSVKETDLFTNIG
jgi:hypothetical protein